MLPHKNYNSLTLNKNIARLKHCIFAATNKLTVNFFETVIFSLQA